MNIDQLQPGPELDQLIAKRVMEWTVCEDDNGSLWLGTDGIVNGWAFSEWRDTNDPEMTDICRREFIERWMPRGVFRPSVDWAAVGLVVEKIVTQSTIEITSQKGYRRARIIPDDKPYNATQGYGETAPLAICRAILVGVTNEKT